MGLLIRRRRPLMRVAAGAAVGTAAYQAGKRGAERGGQPTSVDEPPGGPVGAPAGTPAPAAPGRGPTDELDRLAELHASGALTDAEFTAAKSQLLGT
jgi:hypothetical protein